MKKYTDILVYVLVFAIITLCSIPFAAWAQESQFSRVLLLEAREDKPVEWTVPKGKVWKIVSAGSECASGPLYVFFNGKLAFFLFGDKGTVGNTAVRNRSTGVFPVWLSSETNLGHSTSKNCNKLYRWFSVLEYDITP